MGVEKTFLGIDVHILVSVLLVLASIGLIYIFYVHLYLPLKNKYKEEKENLEITNTRLMALFTELDPEPVFRFDEEGKIIAANREGIKLCGNSYAKGIKATSIFAVLSDLNFSECIAAGKTFNYSAEVNGEFYDLIVKGIPGMKFGQIYCNNITQSKKIEEELTLSRKRLRELSNHMQKLQEEEKQKISRELHDSFGQLLTSIKLNLEQIQDGLPADDINRTKIDDVFILLNEAMSGIREISYKLKPRILDDFGLIPSLKSLCQEISQKSGIKGIFQAYKLEERLNSDLETGLYRITQEALNNVVKHSRAKEFSVQLVRHPEFLRLMIEDDGIGFNPDKVQNGQNHNYRMGLINMSERVLSFNGKILIDSREGSGTEIIVEIPTEDGNGYN